MNLKQRSIKELEELLEQAYPELTKAQAEWSRWLQANPDMARHYGFTDEHDARPRRGLAHVEQWQKRQALLRWILEVADELKNKSKALSTHQSGISKGRPRKVNKKEPASYEKVRELCKKYPGLNIREVLIKVRNKGWRKISETKIREIHKAVKNSAR